MNDLAFWNSIGDLIVNSHIVVDRPKGSRHPRYNDMIYPLDYGYLDGTTSADGEGIDVWIGSHADRQLIGIVCTIDSVKRDSEIKLLLGCTDAEVKRVCSFHDSNAMKCLFICNPLAHKTIPSSVTTHS